MPVEAPFTCEKTFAKKYQLVSHVNNGEKPHLCNVHISAKRTKIKQETYIDIGTGTSMAVSLPNFIQIRFCRKIAQKTSPNYTYYYNTFMMYLLKFSSGGTVHRYTIY